MSNWTLRAILAVGVASLGLNVATLSLVWRDHGRKGGTSPLDLVASAERAAPSPYKRLYTFHDQSTGKESSALLPDEIRKMQSFAEEAQLSDADKKALRERVGALLQQEVAIADKMAAAGLWSYSQLTPVSDEFWKTELTRLPPGTAARVAAALRVRR